MDSPSSLGSGFSVDLVVRILFAANRAAYPLPHIDLRRGDTRAARGPVSDRRRWKAMS